MPLHSRQSLSAKGQRETLSNEISFNEAIILERQQGILDIEETMKEIHEMFKDIGVIVSEQGELMGMHYLVQQMLSLARPH